MSFTKIRLTYCTGRTQTDPPGFGGTGHHRRNPEGARTVSSVASAGRPARPVDAFSHSRQRLTRSDPAIVGNTGGPDWLLYRTDAFPAGRSRPDRLVLTLVFTAKTAFPQEQDARELEAIIHRGRQPAISCRTASISAGVNRCWSLIVKFTGKFSRFTKLTTARSHKRRCG